MITDRDQVALLDHDRVDVRSERVVHAMGGTACACVRFLETWRWKKGDVADLLGMTGSAWHATINLLVVARMSKSIFRLMARQKEGESDGLKFLMDSCIKRGGGAVPLDPRRLSARHMGYLLGIIDSAKAKKDEPDSDPPEAGGGPVPGGE